MDSNGVAGRGRKRKTRWQNERMVSDDARGGFARNGKQPQWPFLEAVGGALRTVWGKYPAGAFREEEGLKKAGEK